MNKKYLIISAILACFFFTCLLVNRCFLDSGFLISCAWGEEPITNTEKWQKLVEISARQGTPDDDLNRILGVIRKAEDEKFPTEPFLNKALEGMSKRISPTAILQVLKVKMEHFHTCQKILQTMPEVEKEPDSQRQHSLTIMTESTARGVNKKELEELAGLAPTPRSVNLANASEDLATFKNQDFSSADAMEIVKTGLQYGIYKERNKETAMIIQQAKQKGISTDELKGFFLSNMQRGNGMRGILRFKPSQGNSSRQQPQGGGNNSRGGPSSRSHR